MKTVYIAWAGFQRRAVSMQALMGFKLFHLPAAQGGPLVKLAGYIRQGSSTIRILRNERPDIVWIQVPPNFIPHLLMITRIVTGKKFKILLDCHNAALRSPWIDTPFFAHSAKRADAVIVHNDDIAAKARDLLLDGTNIIVLEDPPSTLRVDSASGAVGDYILVPCSFADDEPVDMVLEAARHAPGLQFKITGRLEKAQAKGLLSSCPENVQFTGFVSESDFNDLLQQASVVLGITTFEDIQLSVANEAIGAGKALVLSGTATLTKMFSDCADFFDNTSSDLITVMKSAMGNRKRLEERSIISASQRVESWKARVASAGFVSQ